jgi:hypothetical protein
VKSRENKKALMLKDTSTATGDCLPYRTAADLKWECQRPTTNSEWRSKRLKEVPERAMILSRESS